MANFCTLQNTPEYQRMKQCASTSDIPALDLLSKYHVLDHNKLPRYDEIDFLDSQELLKHALNITNNKIKKTNIETLLEYTGTQSIDEALPILHNKLHPDLLIEVYPMGESLLLTINKRPSYSKGKPTILQKSEVYLEEHKKQIFQTMLFELKQKLGINFNYISVSDLNNEFWGNIANDAKLSNGFIYNGEIYINTDLADIDTPLHELTHILIGNIRFIDPELYLKLLESVAQIPNVLNTGKYLHRTKNDILEEILVTEFSKYLVDQPSIFDTLTKELSHDVKYYLYRCLDTMLNGEYSVKTINHKMLGNNTLTSLSEQVHSKKFANTRTSSVDESMMHRMVNNQKSELLKSGELIEEC